MSKLSESAVDRRCNNVAEEDCPLCLEPLPPFWDRERLQLFICCGKSVCKSCHQGRCGFLDRAHAEGTFGKEEEQLASACPFCRTKFPTDADGAVKMMRNKFVEEDLPLHFYGDFGQYYLKGRGGVEVDVERGMELVMLGAEKGDPTCQSLLRNCYRDGSYGVQQSTDKAKRWYLAATEQGHAPAEYNLAFISKDEGNDAEYLRYMRGSASKGFDEACYNLGVIYYNGDNGAQKSTEEAIRILTPAAERGHAKSMGLLGVASCSGPLPRDNPNFVKGVHWVWRSTEAGDQTAVANWSFLVREASSACFRCYKEALPEEAFLRCSRCRAAWYCSKDCQVQHWKAEEGGHKQFCIKWEQSGS